MGNQLFQKRIVRDAAYPVIVVLILLLTGLFVPQFLTQRNILNVLKQSSVAAIATVAQTMVIITGGIDLSCGSMMTFSAMINALLLLSGWPILLSVAVALVAGTLFGMVSGIMVTRLKIPPFIATLVIGNIAAGLAMILCKGSSIANLPPSNNFIGNGRILGIPFPIYVMVVVVVIGSLLTLRTSFGNSIYGIGNNRKVVQNEGINTRRVLVSVYAISGFCSSLAGIVLAGWLNSVHPTQGAYYQLDIIAAAVIGGTSMLGGEGKVLNSVIGAIIISALRTALNLLAVNAYIQNLLIGTTIIVVVAVTVFVSQRSEKKTALF